MLINALKNIEFHQNPGGAPYNDVNNVIKARFLYMGFKVKNNRFLLVCNVLLCFFV
jgi:hypothetical protein